MATTISQSFLELKKNLEITSPQVATISARQKGVRRVMEVGIDLIDPFSFLTGSYSRQTLITPLKEADIDIFFVLNSEHYHHFNGQNGNQAGLLDYVRRTLKKTYTKTPDISRNGQAVTIRFDDFVVDVVPGFKRKGGGFLIPNSINQSWISTDPKKHVEIMSIANKAHNNDFVPLIKMIKAWNKNNGKYFSSFHLEVIALEVLEGIRISDFPSGVRYFFDKGRTLVAQKNLDPAGYGGDVGSYINTYEKIQEAVTKFQLAYDRAIKAEDYEARGYVKDAVDMWIKIFGDYFPTYG
ncbi:MAG: nucleotidyltransferase [Candidatus Moraniibacteriota bacterium]|nr:MAG: nucleotidyltransferase [Candidatus Moranbacteria bacterium]